jgi:hypothetical protein
LRALSSTIVAAGVNGFGVDGEGVGEGLGFGVFLDRSLLVAIGRPIHFSDHVPEMYTGAIGPQFHRCKTYRWLCREGHDCAPLELTRVFSRYVSDGKTCRCYVSRGTAIWPNQSNFAFVWVLTLELPKHVKGCSIYVVRCFGCFLNTTLPFVPYVTARCFITCGALSIDNIG